MERGGADAAPAEREAFLPLAAREPQSQRGRHRRAVDDEPADAVRARLFHALPPQLTQWMLRQPRARRDSAAASPEQVEPEANEAYSREEEAADQATGEQTTSRRRGSSAAAATTRIPVTLRVLPGASRRSPVPADRSATVLHEIRIDADELPQLLSLVSQGSPPPPMATTQLSSASAPTESAVDATSPVVSPRSAASSDDISQGEELSTMDEFQTLFRRCHHTLPFIALFLFYFLYQHATGIIVFVIGSVAVAGLDQRLRAQIALKESASRMYLAGIIAICVLDTLVLTSLDSEPNPLKHLARTVAPKSGETTPHGALVLELLWIVVVNDFIIRFWSLALKAVIAAARPNVSSCGVNRSYPDEAPGVLPTASDAGDIEEGGNRKFARSNVAFFRRKRKLFGIVELGSIFLRSLLAGVPWCSYYQLCGSKFIANVFTFIYVFGKSVILGSQGRRIIQLVRSFVTLGLEHATYVSKEEVAESGLPDCSICYETMKTPVKLSCTHMFCEDCVMEWFDRERSCPLCRAAIVSTSQADDEVKPQYLDGSTSLFPQLF